MIDTAHALAAERIVVVYGHGGEQVREVFADPLIDWAEQAEQLGTGHAVQQALPYLDGVDQVLVLYGDVPLISPRTLRRLLDQTEEEFGLLTVTLDDPTGYGRIVRDDTGRVVRIVEQKDATPDELGIREINTGIMLIGAAQLRGWLGRLSNDNSQGEYYLTDIIAMAVADGVQVHVGAAGARRSRQRASTIACSSPPWSGPISERGRRS